MKCWTRICKFDVFSSISDFFLSCMPLHITWLLGFKKACFSPIFREGQEKVPSLFLWRNIYFSICELQETHDESKIEYRPILMVQSVFRNRASVACRCPPLYVEVGWAFRHPDILGSHPGENPWVRHLGKCGQWATILLGRLTGMTACR